jgi:hypothetical protein
MPKKKTEWEKPAIFVFGVAFVVVLIVLAVFFPNPSDFQYFIFRTVLALAAAGVAALIPHQEICEPVAIGCRNLQRRLPRPQHSSFWSARKE